MKSTSEKCLDFTSLFEAEVLVRLLLWRWEHPSANDEEFANDLLESASIVLRNAVEGKQCIEGIPATSLNFVAAVWYAEWCAVETGKTDPESSPDSIEQREKWLSNIQRALPSCFCDPSDLHQ